MGSLRQNGIITQSESTVPVSIITDQAGIKAVNVNYTNTTKKTLYIFINAQYTITAGGGQAVLQGKIDGWVRNQAGISAGVLNGERFNISLILVCPPTSVYRIEDLSANGTATIVNWIEVY